MTKTTKIASLATTMILLALPAAAEAHVTLQPSEVPAGGFTVLNVRVPNEQEDAATDKVEVEMPDGFAFASYEPIPGWKTDVKTEKLDQPVETDDGQVNTQVHTITWTATDASAAIQPGQFRDFPISVGLPEGDEAGDVLTFPAIQTYDNGDVVRWIGDPDAEEPAPTVTLTEPVEDHHAATADDEHADSATVEVDDEDSDGAPIWLAILGVILGAAGIIVGGVAIRRRG